MSTKLPSVSELYKAEREAKRKLKALFKDPSICMYRANLKLGLARLTEKGQFSRMITRYMARRNIRSTDALAWLLFIGHDHSEALTWLRNPCAFRFGLKNEERGEEEYLLALSELELDAKSGSYKPIPK